MIPTSEAWKAYAADSTVFHIKAVLTLTDGTVFQLTDTNFMSGSLSFTDAVSSGNSFDLGSVISNTFSCTLNNFDGVYDGKNLSGATLAIQLGVIYGDGTEEWINRGIYTVDRPDSLGRTIQITAYDFADKLNRLYTGKTIVDNAITEITFPLASSALAKALCDYCRVAYDSDFWRIDGDLPVAVFEYNKSTTCRQVLSWLLQINGGFARAGTDGKLAVSWYSAGQWAEAEALNGGEISPWGSAEDEDGGSIQPWAAVTGIDGGMNADFVVSKISSASIYTDDIRITGIRAYTNNTVSESEFATAGSSGYILAITDNPLITAGNMADVANTVYAQVGGMTFRPYEAQIFGDPSIQAGDSIVITDYTGQRYFSYITEIRYPLGSLERISLGAETPSDRENKYANPQTATIQGAVTAAYDYIQAKKISADYISAGDLGASGTITASALKITGGEMGGMTIDEDSLSTGFEGTYTYTEEDYTRIREIILGNLEGTPQEYALYDTDASGTLKALDYVRIRNLLDTGEQMIRTNFTLNPHSLVSMIDITNTLNDYQTFIGANVISIPNLFLAGKHVEDIVFSEMINPNIGYLKWKSGLLICWWQNTVAINCNAAWGSGYYGSYAPGNYPHAFASLPCVTQGVQAPGGNVWSGGFNKNSATVNNPGNFIFYSFAPQNNIQCTLSYIAVGKWQ